MIVEMKEIEFVDPRYPTEEEIKRFRIMYSLEMAIRGGYIDTKSIYNYLDYINIIEE